MDSVLFSATPRFVISHFNTFGYFPAIGPVWDDMITLTRARIIAYYYSVDTNVDNNILFGTQ